MIFHFFVKDLGVLPTVSLVLEVLGTLSEIFIRKKGNVFMKTHGGRPPNVSLGAPQWDFLLSFGICTLVKKHYIGTGASGTPPAALAAVLRLYMTKLGYTH